MRRLSLMVTAAMLLSACAKKDKSPPPAPVVDPLPASTELDHLTLNGSAQYNAKVTITRTPAFESGAPSGIVADQYTARFTASLPLDVGDNQFSVIAANQNGPGKATTFTVTRVAAKPHTIQLALDSRIVEADQGTLTVRAHIENPEAISLSGFKIDLAAKPSALTTSADGGVPPEVTATATTDESGFAVATLQGLTTAGEWSVTATSEDNPDAKDSALFVVNGGAPSSISLTLSATGVSSGAAISVPAGTEVDAAITVRDQPHNVLNVPFTLYTDAPGALIEGSKILSLNTARSQAYRVVATVPATPATGGQVLTAEATVTVTPAAVTSVSLTLDPTAPVAGSTISVTAHALDAFGNVADGDGFAVTLTADLCGADPTCATPTPDTSAQNPRPANAAVIDNAAKTVKVFTANYERITASVVATTGAAAQTKSAIVRVVPAAPAGVAIALSAGGAPLGSSPSIAAGSPLDIAVTVSDAYANATSAPFSLASNAPTLIQGGQLTVTAAGSYMIVATIAGTLISTTAPFTVTPGAIASLALSASPTQVVAGEKVALTAVAKDGFGNAIPNAPIAWTSSPGLAASFTPPCSTTSLTQGFVDPTHFVAYDLSSGGAFTLTATSGTLTSSASITVKPGAASRFAGTNPAAGDCSDLFKFVGSGGNLVDTVTVSAGGTVGYRYGVVDAYGNSTTGPVRVFVDAPNAQVIDDGVSGSGQIANLSTAGTYTASAYINGLASPSAKVFTVGTGPADSIRFFLDTSLAAKGDVVRSFGLIHDGFGNLISCTASLLPGYAVAVTPSAGSAPQGPPSCDPNGAFEQDFKFSVDNTYSLTATFTPASGPAVSSSAFVTILGIDSQPPTALIENVVVNGTPCTPALSPSLCNVSPGDTIDFDLVANDNVSLAQVSYSAYFTTTGSLRTRTVLVASNATLPVTTHFTFNVPGGATTEDVPLVGMAIDGAGNQATSTQTTLHVNPFTLTNGRTATIIARNGAINAPNDVALDSANNIFVGNDGNADLLRIPAGSSTPSVFSGYNLGSDSLIVDGVGDLFVGTITGAGTGVITKVASSGGGVASYLTLANGQDPVGLSLTGAVAAKGLVDATTAIDGDTLTVGSKTYEVNTALGCGNPSNVCVNVSSGGNINQALATAIAANSVEASATFNNASCGGGSGTCVVLAAKNTGEAGDSVVLASSTARITRSGATLREGHDEHFWLGQNGVGDPNIYRYPETLTGNPTLPTGNHGAYNVNRSQMGVSVQDFTTASSANVRDLSLYYAQAGGRTNLYGFTATEALGGLSIGQVFNVSQVTGGPGFNALWDVVLDPVSGCLLVSDEGRGNIYTVDVRNRSNANPQVSIIASGLNAPRGMSIGPDNNLYVADNGLNAVIKITRSSPPASCF